MIPRTLPHMTLLAFVVFGLAACKQESSNVAQGVAKASQTYSNYFGEPPAPKQGECFARVGFYPLKNRSGKLTAVPFFLFREENQLELLLERLVGNDPDYFSHSQLFTPFPPGSKVRLVSQQGEAVVLELSFQQTPRPDLVKAMVAALTESATQFEGLKKVRILIDGAPLPDMPADGYSHVPRRIEFPGPPTLLLVVGAWEKDAANPEEILADFDRPVTVESFSLKDSSGQKVEGDYFTSAFDMAVIVHPENSASIREGMSLRAEWQVVDRLGRKGRGSGEFTLLRHDHADGF